MVAGQRRGISLRLAIDGPTYDSAYGKAAEVDCSALLDGQRLYFFAVNRNLDEPAPVRIVPANGRFSAVVDADILTGSDPTAANSFERRDVVRSRSFDDVRIDAHGAQLMIPFPVICRRDVCLAFTEHGSRIR